MTRDEFLTEVRRETGFMLPQDRNRIVSHFITQLGSADNEDITDKLGTPKEAVRRYISAGRNEISPAVRIMMIAAGVIAAPIVIDAGLIAAGIAIFLAALAGIIIAGLPFAAAAMWLGGIGMAASALFSGMTAGNALCFAGVGLLISAVGVLLLILVIKVYGKFIPWLFRSVYGLCKRLLTWLKTTIGRLL